MTRQRRRPIAPVRVRDGAIRCARCHDWISFAVDAVGRVHEVCGCGARLTARHPPPVAEGDPEPVVASLVERPGSGPRPPRVYKPSAKMRALIGRIGRGRRGT